MNSLQWYEWGCEDKGIVLKLNNVSVDLGNIDAIKLKVYKTVNGDHLTFPLTFSVDGEEGLKLRVVEQNTYKLTFNEEADDFNKQLYNELLVGGFAGFEIIVKNSIKSSILGQRWLNGYSMLGFFDNTFGANKINSGVTDNINGNVITLNFDRIPNIFPYRNTRNYYLFQNNRNHQYLWDFKKFTEMRISFKDGGSELFHISTIQDRNFITIVNFDLSVTAKHTLLRYIDKYIDYIEFFSPEIINTGDVVDKYSSSTILNNVRFDNSTINYHLDKQYIRFNFMKQIERTKLSAWLFANNFELYVSD